MSKIPCRKCKSCGLYHDLSVMICDECGADIKNIPALIVETDDIPKMEYGEINESVSVFVQKCSACGALNFTADKEDRVKVCYNCNKVRVADIEPVEYCEQGEKLPEENKTEEEPAADEASVPASGNVATAKISFVDEDDDEESAQWQGILGNIRKAVGAEAESPAPEVNTKPEIKAPAPAADEEDEEEVTGWAGILGGKAPQGKGPQASPKPAITLTAITYGRLSFSFEAKEDKRYMLGRSANQGEFLSKDGRVGNEHCYLFFRDGVWYVKDNNARNGTMVNSRVLDINGESRLNDGDELKLGHNADSMAFRVNIG